MPSDVLHYLTVHYLIVIAIGLSVAIALIAGLILRFSSLRQLENRAWGPGRSALSRTDRREIRRAVREGRPVADQRLAVPAVLFGEWMGSSTTWTSYGANPPVPHRMYVFGRIVFPALGTLAIVPGILDHDTMGVLRGIMFFAFTLMYLPPSERWTATLRARREQRRQSSIDANRRLSARA